MIAEPYICTKGPEAESIQWCFLKDTNFINGDWRPYSDFELDVLDRLDADMGHVGLSGTDGYFLIKDGWQHTSRDLIGYCGCDYKADTESGRLLKRAEFLRRVCEREGVEWLPKEKAKVCPTCGLTENGFTPEEETEILRAAEDAKGEDAISLDCFNEQCWRKALLDFLGRWLGGKVKLGVPGSSSDAELDILRRRYAPDVD